MVNKADCKHVVTTVIFKRSESSKLCLLIGRRAGEPALGEWAMPGGHVDPAESLFEAASRELLEETGFSVELSYVCTRITNEVINTVFAGICHSSKSPRSSSDLKDVYWCSTESLPPLAFDNISYIKPAGEALAERSGIIVIIDDTNMINMIVDSLILMGIPAAVSTSSTFDVIAPLLHKNYIVVTDKYDDVGLHGDETKILHFSNDADSGISFDTSKPDGEVLKYILAMIRDELGSDIEIVAKGEAIPPLGTFKFLGKEYPYWGNPDGRNKTEDYDVGKFNRFAKLGERAEETLSKLGMILQSDPTSIDGRCAYAATIMMLYGIRIGNEDSAEGYESGVEENKGELVQTYGTTTLLNKHVTLVGESIMLDFLGKRQVQNSVEIANPYLVKIGKQYKTNDPEAKWLGIDYEILFKFVKKNIGDQFVPKDLRTFCAGTTAFDAARALVNSGHEAEPKLIAAAVAARLSNTPSVARARYIDYRLLDWVKYHGDDIH